MKKKTDICISVWCFVRVAISALMPPENAAKVIQSHFRSLKARQNFLKLRNAVVLMQNVFRAWLALKQNSAPNHLEICEGLLSVLINSLLSDKMVCF